jgi:hypothetical protein
VARIFADVIRLECAIPQSELKHQEMALEVAPASIPVPHCRPTEDVATDISVDANVLLSTAQISTSFSTIKTDVDIDNFPIPPTLELTATPIRSERSLNIYDFVEDEYIGSGSWGAVHLVRHRKTGQQVAIKSIQKAKVVGTEIQVLREQETLRAVTGQRGVLDLLASFHDGAYFYIVTVSLTLAPL